MLSLEAMSINIYILKATGCLNPFAKDIEKQSEKAIKKVAARIPISNVDIVFYDNPKEAIPEIGIGGYTPSPHLVLIALNPQFPNFNKTVNQEIARTIAHELYHCLRSRGPGYGKSLLAAMVSEGMADHFDLEVNGGKPRLWNVALSDKQMFNLGEKAKKEFQNENYNHNEWFFGSKDGTIPRWSGYTLGFKLVSDYLARNLHLKPSKLYDIKAKKFQNV